MFRELLRAFARAQKKSSKAGSLARLSSFPSCTVEATVSLHCIFLVLNGKRKTAYEGYSEPSSFSRSRPGLRNQKETVKFQQISWRRRIPALSSSAQRRLGEAWLGRYFAEPRKWLPSSSWRPREEINSGTRTATRTTAHFLRWSPTSRGSHQGSRPEIA